MKLINADRVVHWQSYDDEFETFQDHEGTIAEFLDAMTDEGCPGSVSVLPSALQEAIRRIETKVDEVYRYPKTEYAEGYVNACKAVMKMLKSLSAVDAVPVRHGRWIPYDWEYLCSECRHLSACQTVYCSACGARMDGKGDRMDDRLKQCRCCTNYIDSDLCDEEPWCRVKPYHQIPKTKPGEPRCEHFKSPVFVCTWDEGR